MLTISSFVIYKKKVTQVSWLVFSLLEDFFISLFCVDEILACMYIC